MKKTLKMVSTLLMCYLLTDNLVFAEITQPATPTYIVRQKTAQDNSVTYDFIGTNAIGRDAMGGDYKYFVYRSHDSFSRDILGIPSGVIVDDVTMIISFGANHYDKTMKVVTLSEQPSFIDGSSAWTTIGNGTDLFDADITCATTQSITSDNLKQQVQDMVDNNTIKYWGFMSNNEGDDGTGNTFTVMFEFHYHTPTYSYTVENSFGGGKIKVDGDPNINSGTSFPWTLNTNHNLEALNQTYSGDGIYRVWNMSGVPSSISNWQKRLPGQPKSDIINTPNPTYVYNTKIEDVGASIIAEMFKRFSIARNDQTEFDGTILVNNVIQIVEQNSGTVPAPATKTVGSNVYNFYGWESGANGVFTPTGNQTYPYAAIYKASLASNNAAAFANTSARKALKTPDGNYHLVYESMGGVWYEKLSESGTSISIKQIASVGKNPAVAANNSAWVVIVYQAQSQGTMNRLTILTLSTSTNQVLAETQVKTEIPTSYTDNLNPSVALTNANGVCVVWEEEAVGMNVGGLYYRLGNYNSTTPGFTWSTPEANSPLTVTNGRSKTPEVQWNGSSGSSVFHLVWEHAHSEHSYISYSTLTYSGGTTMSVSTPLIISDYYGSNFNTKPSLIGVAGGGARVCWVGFEDEYSPAVTIFRDPSYGAAWYFGESVTNASINKSDDGGYIIGWSENGTQYYSNNSSLYTLGTISSTGADLQVVNSGTRSTMRAIGYNTTTSPYRFTVSNHIGSGAPQKSSQLAANRSRGGIIVTNGVGIGFSIGDGTANGEGILFPAIPESLICASVDQFNSYLVSEPFLLNDNSDFTFGVHTWVSDSAKLQSLPNGIGVDFSVELIDDKSKDVIGVLEKTRYSNTGFTTRKREGYKVDTKGIGNATVRMRITTHTNDKAQFLLTSGVARSSSIGLKKDGKEYKTVGYKGIEPVTTYALDQNYPNPFNPTTTISYALPNDGMVTIKIYDALGREVKTLVNEFKSSGRYTAEFDASRLASGIYIYKLVSGDYSAVKKMMLVK